MLMKISGEAIARFPPWLWACAWLISEEEGFEKEGVGASR